MKSLIHCLLLCPLLCLLSELSFAASLDENIENTVQAYLNTFDIPGAVVLVGHGHGVSYHQAFGSFDGNRPLEKNAVFDLASITKLFTATALLKQIKNTDIVISSSLSEVLPSYNRETTEHLSLEDLLRHESGMRAVAGPAKKWHEILAIDPEHKHGEFLYSDVNYLVLGKTLEELSGKSLDLAVRDLILTPLGMRSSGFLPMKSVQNCARKCVPTMRDKEIGVVHDPVSRGLGGVAGHAGLFASAQDISRFASIFLNEGYYLDRQIISSRQVKAMTEKEKGRSRGLGFDITSRFSDKPRGDYFAKGLSFGHSGYTGTTLWIDPTLDTYLIVLSNPVYAKDWKFAKKGMLKMARELANIVGRKFSH